MANVIINDSNLTNIANAIREKNGTDKLYKPAEMAQAISEIKSGGYNIQKGTFTLAVDTKKPIVYHNLGERPDFILVYTEDYQKGIAQHTTTVNSDRAGFFYFDLSSIYNYQKLTSSIVSESPIFVNFTEELIADTQEYKINVASPSSSSYIVAKEDITDSNFICNLTGANSYWRAGVTFNYIIGKVGV